MSKAKKGEGHPLSKLTLEQVIKIKKLLKEHLLTQHEIAYLFDIKQTTISDIKRGRTWAVLT